MRLDKVEMVGFKSFCDKQEVDFKGGVTGIVGPNGCGKSNISDAISWVLGEQSAKSLRGTSMEDVIFGGSQSRQPLAMAEVSLRVSGLNGNSPDGSPECVVSRRLYRNGESEYLMNGQTCRLRDIHELFMDTGLGSKAYSIIEQGKIGLILSSKPADRRALIEEAAGITKYKARRRQTQLKLEATQQNLLRVNDIVHEVEKQLESLKRQAGKARRYRALREEMKGLEKVLYGRRFLELSELSSKVAARLTDEAEREQLAAMALGNEEAQMEGRRGALYAEEERLAEARARLSELTLAVDRHQGQSGYCQQQIAETETRTQDARREATELLARVGPLSQALDARRGDSTRLKDQLGEAEAEAHGAESAVQQAAARQAVREREQEQAREVQIGILGRMAALQNAGQAAQGTAERAGAALLKLGAEEAELAREQARVEGALRAAELRGQQLDALRARLTDERDAASARAAAGRVQAEALGREADAVQSERDGLAGRLASLQDMVTTHAAFDQGVRALLERPQGIEVQGVVADSVETEPEYERLVEGFLGDRLQAVLVPDAGQALSGVRYLEESGAGRGTFLPLASARTRSHCGHLRDVAGQEPKVKGLLSDLYRVAGPNADRIRASLPDALVVSTLEDAFDVISRQGPLACATLAGESVRGAMVEGGRGVKGLLAPRREIREVGVRLEELSVRLVASRDRQQTELLAAEAAATESRNLEERIHGAEKDLVAIRHDLATSEEEVARLGRKAGVLDTERRQAEDERDQAAARRLEIDSALAEAEAEKTRESERLSALGVAVTEARSDTETAQARHAEARSQWAALRERATAVEAECERLARDHAELLDRIAGAESRAEDLVRRQQALEGERGTAEAQLSEALQARDRVTGEVAVVEDGVREVRGELEAREQALKERRREREALRSALSELEVQQARAGSDLDHLARECHQALAATAAEASQQLTDQDQTRDLSTLEIEIQEMRDRLEKMGPVNVLAVEQAQEYEERHQFLTAQRQDLLDSIAELDRAIRSIDKTSKERFREAFQVINQHFGEIFKQLFGGGTAGLSLLDEEDILESGIDVMAQPPGKRLQNVMLLSGGEKALTAISLLFAIFQYKPSPFCILDEVDAPLDDANIGRFVRMLEGLKEQTQFVVITHSRKTMEIADQLYGVTMEEPGVSKLVSVRLN